MKADLLKSYIKYSYPGIILWIIIVALFYHFDHDKFWYTFYPIFWVISLLGGYFRYVAKLDTIKKLKAKGLTEQDLWNIEFVKKWEETRKEGLWKYCVRDGGIIAGAGLSVVISLIYFAAAHNAFKNIIDDPGNMFSLIGCAYIIGAAVGVIMYRILWWYNEKRFIRLTDPFNTMFASKKASFND